MSGIFRSNVSGSRGTRHSLRKDGDGARRLTIEHRWYAGAIATLLAGALVFTGVTPAMAEDAATPPAPAPTETAATSEPSQPAVETPAETPAAPAPTETTPAPAPTETTPAPAPTETTPAPTPTETPADDPAKDEAPTVGRFSTDSLIGVQSLAADCAGGPTVCGSLTMTNVVVNTGGGTATTADWTLLADMTAPADNDYAFTSGQTRQVDRPATYTLSATPVPDTPATTSYATTYSCTLNDTNGTTRMTFVSPVLTFIGTGNNDQIASCTATHTFTPPATATITVNVGGDRNSADSNVVDALPGVTLRLYSGDASGPASPFTADWATCVSIASGDCTFTVPDVQIAMGAGGSGAQTGGNAARQFWIVQEDQPAGWRENPALVTGPDGGPFAPTAYTFRTPAMTVSGVFESGVNFMLGTGNSTARASSGIWQVSRDNPQFPSQCGIDVALIIDLSGSLGNQLQQVKNAAIAMVNALRGTGSTIGIYTFASNAPASAGGNFPATSVSTDAGADAVIDHINTFTTPTGSTNWDRGIGQVPRGVFDVGIVITDGNPTVYAAGAGPGNYTRFREVENGIFSANRLKAPQASLGNVGTRVIALGVGAGIGGAADNLIAISGPTVNSDYFQTATFDGAALVLRALALGNCLGSLTIVKQEVPAGNTNGDTTGSTVASGWQFTTTSATPNVTVSGSPGTTGDDGTAVFPLTFSQGTTTGDISVVENLAGHTGFAIFPVDGGFNARCTASSPGQPSTPVPVENIPGQPGFTLDVPFNRSVSCEVYNKPSVPATLTLEKEVVNDGGGSTPASQWTLTATDPQGVTPINRKGTGSPIASTGPSTVTAGVAYTLSESAEPGYTQQGPWTCVNGAGGSVPVTGGNTVTVPLNTTVTCRIVNNDIDSTGTIEKAAAIPVQQTDGTWTQLYTVTVTNTSATGAFAYQVQDELLFGTGITWASVTATTTGSGTINPAWDGKADTALATGTVPAGVGNTHVYTIVVAGIVVPAAAAGTPAAQCQPGETPGAGGFLNHTQLFRPGGNTPLDEDYACKQPAFPTVTKTGNAPTQNPNGSWNASYTIEVKNPSVAPNTVAIQATLTDAFPTAPTGWTLTGGAWSVTAASGTPVPIAATFTPGSHTVWTGSIPGNTTYTYTVSGVLVPGASPSPVGSCPESGILNKATVTSGEIVDDDTGCVSVFYDDVDIVKTSTGVPIVDGNPVLEPNNTFQYVLTVSNNGTRPATNVVVTDAVNPRLRVNTVTLPAGWTNDNGTTVSASNQLSVRTASLAIDPDVQIILDVTLLPAAVTAPPVPPGGTPPAAPDPLDNLVNTACVDADGNADVDCDTITIPVRDLTGVVYTSCRSDAPLLGWQIRKSASLAALPFDATWIPLSGGPATDPPDQTFHKDGNTGLVWTELVDWPGSEFTPSGIAIDYPGWRPIVASDIAPGGGYYIPGTTDVMTQAEEELYIYNGLIVDPSELDFAWRLNTQITFTVNPTLVFEAAYPPATPECFQARHTNVEVVKTASVQKSDPRASLSYTIAVANVSSDSAAKGVVVSDAIPSSLKITDVTWPGKGDSSVFPNWQTCEVTGQDAGGYGGTLNCVLFGPLQPVGANEGASAAPTITLSATISPTTTASVITNVAVVDYHTFGDPDDPGRDSDDATVTLSTLPATGGGPALPLIMLGLLALLGGAATLIVVRRRRGEAQPTEL